MRILHFKARVTWFSESQWHLQSFVSQKMVIRSAPGDKNDSWKPFTKSGLFCDCLTCFHCLCSSVYTVPGVIFIPSNSYYLSIINILEKVKVHLFFDLSCRKNLPRAFSGVTGFSYLAQVYRSTQRLYEVMLCWVRDSLSISQFIQLASQTGALHSLHRIQPCPEKGACEWLGIAFAWALPLFGQVHTYRKSGSLSPKTFNTFHDSLFYTD